MAADTGAELLRGICNARALGLFVRSLASLRFSLRNVGGREIREDRGEPRLTESRKYMLPTCASHAAVPKAHP